MKVSVVVPVHNGQKYIAECLEGLARQTHRDLEVIVVDDGSTDQTAQIALRFEGVRVISLPFNQGLSVARNTGIEAASGDFIWFMDVDDLVNDEFVAEMLRAAVDNDADIACSGMIHEPKPHRTTLFGEEMVLVTPREKFRATRAAIWSYVWRYLFRTDFLRRLHLRFEPGRLVEDMPFTVQAVYFANRVVTVPGAVYQYRLIPGSIMQVRDLEHVRQRRRDLRHAKTLRHYFARKHGFTIPGVPTWGGIFSLLYVKWLT